MRFPYNSPRPLSLRCCGLQYAHDRCSDSQNAPGTVNLVCGFARNGEALRVHAMFGDLLCSHGQKRSRANVQSH